MSVNIVTAAEAKQKRAEALAVLGVTLEEFRADLADYQGESYDLAEWYLRATSVAVHKAVETVEDFDYLLGDL